MRRSIGSAAAAFALLLLCFAADAPARKAKTCDVKGSITLLSSSQARVYVTRDADGDRLYGCWRSHGVERFLGAFSEEERTRYSDVRLTSRYVAFVSSHSSSRECKNECSDPIAVFNDVEIADLKTGRLRWHFGADPLPGSLALSSKGAATWKTG